MPEPLKNKFGPDIPKTIAGMISGVHPGFDTKAFVREALQDYDSLELLPRGWRIARALRPWLPPYFPDAAKILVASLGPKLDATESQGMAPFLYLPHSCFVAEFGLDHFEASMAAQYEITQRFTAEFSIRPFIEKYPEASLARLRVWATDPSEHVRRLVSEGTRPRLPWASRLRVFEKDPTPVIALLELLKDDPEPYVRRSVANHLNDIGKDHPRLLTDIAIRWMKDAPEPRRKLIRHALRSAIKRGDQAALKLFGVGTRGQAKIRNAVVSPRRARIGGEVALSFEVSNVSKRAQTFLVDFRIFYCKANGESRPKVFKLKTVELAPRASFRLSKKISLNEMTTRKHHPGLHRVEALINGEIFVVGEFRLTR
ncbi:MAG: DNA alkylation repair protein [Burkholderiales bacterium]